MAMKPKQASQIIRAEKAALPAAGVSCSKGMPPPGLSDFITGTYAHV